MGGMVLEYGQPMKTLLKSLLTQTPLRQIWNRGMAGNRIHAAGAHNRIQLGNSLLTRTTIRIQGDGNSLVIGDGCRLHDLKILMIGDSLCVEISDHCQLRGKIKAEDAGSHIAIGAGTTMENTYLGAYEGTTLRIGNDCMLAEQVGIRTGDMHSILDAATGQRLNPSESIEIEPHVWLCRGVTVLKGCTIGAGTIVGGSSIVTASLPDHALAVGVPAKILREPVEWRRERL
jgi:acetyltransferase-like isoleucine patch superfamily enzyme